MKFSLLYERNVADTKSQYPISNICAIYVSSRHIVDNLHLRGHSVTDERRGEYRLKIESGARRTTNWES